MHPSRASGSNLEGGSRAAQFKLRAPAAILAGEPRADSAGRHWAVFGPADLQPGCVLLPCTAEP
eukprot:6136839-Alexandrium_andersonii.AAC.1